MEKGGGDILLKFFMAAIYSTSLPIDSSFAILKCTSHPAYATRVLKENFNCLFLHKAFLNDKTDNVCGYSTDEGGVTYKTKFKRRTSYIHEKQSIETS